MSQSTDLSYSKYRDTGELSDFDVVVQGKEFSLHKFPLYTKSDFFRDLVLQGRTKVDLTSFPGGPNTFSLVADFCYNVDFGLKETNVVDLRCAAEYLQMTRGVNLADVTDRFIQDTLVTARLNKTLDNIADLFLQCAKHGRIAETAGIVSKCIDACAGFWLRQRSVRFSPWSPKSDEGITKLANLPFCWFLQLIITSRDRDVRPTILAELVQKYLTNAVKGYFTETQQQSTDEDHAIDHAGSETESVAQSEEDVRKQPSDATAKNSLDKEDIHIQQDNNNLHGVKVDENAYIEMLTNGEPVARTKDLAKVIDTLLSELPDQTPLSATVTPEWLSEMLRITSELECKNRDVLLRAAASILHRLSPSDLATLPLNTIQEAIKEKLRLTPTKREPVILCHIIDTYLREMANRGQLESENFKQLVELIPSKDRENYDGLCEVIEMMMKTEKENQDSDKANQWRQLLSTIDATKLSETTLEKSLNNGVLPQEFITNAAIGLCKRLRSDLDNAKNVILMQESERRHLRQLAPQTTRSMPPTRRSLWKTSYCHRSITRPHTAPPINVSQLSRHMSFDKSSDDLDLKLALWRVNDTCINDSLVSLEDDNEPLW